MGIYSEEQIDAMTREYAAGATHRELAERYGGAAVTVGRTLKRHGVAARSVDESKAMRAGPGIDDAELRRLYLDEGWNIAPLARHFHVLNQAITARLHELAIPVRAGGRARRWFVTDESCHALAAEYREVGNIHTLAERHGCTPPTITAALRRVGQKSIAKGREGEFSAATTTNRGGATYGGDWPTKRDARMQLDGYRCVACGHPRHDKTRKLSVAHLIPVDEFTANDPLRHHVDNLRTLCVPCHRHFDGSVHTEWDLASEDRRFWPVWARRADGTTVVEVPLA